MTPAFSSQEPKFAKSIQDAKCIQGCLHTLWSSEQAAYRVITHLFKSQQNLKDKTKDQLKKTGDFPVPPLKLLASFPWTLLWVR